MSSKPKAVRQDYIAKIRFMNSLPPPPLNPKFLNYNITESTSSKVESEQLMTSLFRRDNFQLYIGAVDNEMGMNLNLINNDGYLDNGDEATIFGMKDEKLDNGERQGLVLHPKDRELLRDAGIGKISKTEPEVSFLRRTEYISERQLPSTNAASAGSDTLGDKKVKGKEEDLDPNAQLAAVENTFSQAEESLKNFSSLRHPTKKRLKAVAAWPILPDTSAMDSKYMAVRFLGSASVSRELQALKRQLRDKYDESFQSTSLKTSLFRPITSEDGEWMTMYQVKDSALVDELHDKLHSSAREEPVNILDEQDDLVNFPYKHTKDYDMTFHRNTKPYEELCIKFESDENNGSKKRKAAYYYPIGGRIDLKKHRASTNAEVNRFLSESTADVINFKIREPNTDELKKMDAARSEYDPMEYEGEDDVLSEKQDVPEEDDNQKLEEPANIKSDLEEADEITADIGERRNGNSDEVNDKSNSQSTTQANGVNREEAEIEINEESQNKPSNT